LHVDDLGVYCIPPVDAALGIAEFRVRKSCSGG
jgi:hypothetical protein